MHWIQKNWPAVVICCIYFVGTIGFIIPDVRDDFASMTWINLLISFLLLLYFQEEIKPSFWISIFVIGLSGYFLEVLGVRTGMLFGNYAYGNNLGLQKLDVPVMIGINWILLVYLSNYVARRLFKSAWIIIPFAALLMTGLDVLIEPFAMRFDLWSWSSGHVPLQNYIMWFTIGLAMQYHYTLSNPQIKNPMAIPLVICMTLFFLIIDLVVIWT